MPCKDQKGEQRCSQSKNFTTRIAVKRFEAAQK